jgi:RNA polymerase sigma-70 factor (ECF subfamily)
MTPLERARHREAEWATLMRAANAGDTAAYDRLLRELASAFRPVARRGLVRAGRSASEAEDIVQEILLAVHLKRHTWYADHPVGPWLRAIARNKLIDALRRRGGRFDLPIEDFVELLPAEDTGPAISEREIDRHVDRLPEGQRRVVRAITVEGATITEAARALGMSQGAVRVALHRGLATLARRSQ